MAFLLKVEVTKFMEENKTNFEELKSGTADVKSKM